MDLQSRFDSEFAKAQESERLRRERSTTRKAFDVFVGIPGAFPDQYRQETFDRPPLVKDGSEWSTLLRRVAPDPGLYFTDPEALKFVERYEHIFIDPNTYRPTHQALVTGYDAYGKPVTEAVTYRPSMIDWEKLAGSYAAALAEANSKIRLLEDEVARLTPPATRPERTTSDVLARCIGLDKTLDAYGR